METDALFNELYSELRRIASVRMRRERGGHTLQTTALINEAYLRLARINGSAWNDRPHFLATAALAMRRILVDHARRRKRRLVLAPPDAEMSAGLPSGIDCLDFDLALDALAEEHERASKVLQFRFILGLPAEVTAEALGVSERTVRGDTSLALAWMRRRFADP